MHAGVNEHPPSSTTYARVTSARNSKEEPSVHDDNSPTARYDRPYRAVLQTNEKKQKHRHIGHSVKETRAHTGTSVRNGRVWPCFFFKSATRPFRDEPHAGGSNAVLLTEA